MNRQENSYAEDGENDAFETCAEIRCLPESFYEFNFMPRGKHRGTWGGKIEKNLKLDQLPKDLHARINMVRMFPDHTYRSELGYKFSSGLCIVLITSEELDFLISI
jgi:hypothetical protein